MDFTTKCLDIMDTSMNDLKDHGLTNLQLDESMMSDKHIPGKKSQNTQRVCVETLQPDISVGITSSNCASPITNYTENTAHIDGYASDLSLDNIHHQLDIVPSFLQKEPGTVDVTENGLNAYPDLICINDNIVCDDPIDLNNIQLYLECFDDSENLATSSSFEDDPSASMQTGTSLLKSDVRLKISFPILTEERDKGYKCCSCKTYFESEEALRSHIMVNHKQQICMCPFCFYNTKSRKYFKNHIQTKHKRLIENFTKQSEEYTELETQQLKSLDFGNIDGDKTNMSSSNKQNNADILSSDEGMPFTTTNSIRLDSGTEIESQETSITHNENIGHKQPSDTTAVISPKMNKFVCSSCKFVTKTSKLLKMHIHAMHDLKRTMFQCTQCSYICKQKRSFLAHTQLHEGSFNFKCEICSKEFVSKSIYTRHKKNHSSDRHHVCDYKHCRKAFKTKGSLTDHKKKVHSNFKLKSDQTDESGHLKNGGNSTYLKNGGNSTCKEFVLNGEKQCCSESCFSPLRPHLSMKTDDTDKISIPENETSCDLLVSTMCSKRSVYTCAESCRGEEMSTMRPSTAAFDSEKSTSEKAGAGEIGTCEKSTCTVSDAVVLELQTKHSNLDRGLVHVANCKNKLKAKTNMEKVHVANGEKQIRKTNGKCPSVKMKLTGTQTKHFQGKQKKTKSFICPYTHCQKTFRDNFNLRNHLCTHEGVKNLPCEICDFVCVQKSSLNYHMKTKHSDIIENS